MVKKVISGTRSGTEKAALAIANKLGVAAESPHGGSSDTAGAGTVSISYLDNRNFELEKKRVEIRVAASNGTLIFSRGHLTRHAEYARKCTLSAGHQLLGIDLSQVSGIQASNLIASWIELYHIVNLYITGPDADEDEVIYSEAAAILEPAILQARAGDTEMGPVAARSRPPRSVDEAVTVLASDLSFGDKSRIANMKQEQLGALDFSLGDRIKTEFRLWSGNDTLLESCRQMAGADYLSADEAVAFLIKKLWQHLQQSDVLKIIK
jgi:hypothetical protein